MGQSVINFFSKRTVRFLLAFIILLLWAIFTPNVLQKGGVDTVYLNLLPVVILLASAVAIIPLVQLKLYERIMVTILIAALGFVISTVLVLKPFEIIFYEYKTWLFWETKHRLIANGVHFGSALLVVLFCSDLYLRIKKRYN